jgi:hypothetical protein
MKIINDASHRHLSTKQPSIGISYRQWDRDISTPYKGRLLNETMRRIVWKTTVRWIPIIPEMYITKILFVRRDWKIEWIPFALRKFRRTCSQSKGIGERRDGSNLSREQCS